MYEKSIQARAYFRLEFEGSRMSFLGLNLSKSLLDIEEKLVVEVKEVTPRGQARGRD